MVFMCELSDKLDEARNMNVEELIELLQQQPLGSEVVVQSYEEGYDPVTDVNPISVQPLEEKPWYSGVYEKSEASGKEAVLIKSRYNRAEKE